MKTENLSWAEAIKAYANGDRIRDRDGTEFWIGGDVSADDVPWFKDEKRGEFRHCNRPLLPCYAPFSIVKPEPKTLSMEEAVALLQAGKDVEIKTHYRAPVNLFGVKVGHQDKRVGLDALEDGDITLTQLSWLDLAERRGWPITVAE